MLTPEKSSRPVRRARGVPAVLFGVLALLSILGLRRAEVSFATQPTRVARPLPPDARAGVTALGKSGGVRMRFALAGARIDYPLQLTESPDSLKYRWLPLGNRPITDAPRPLGGALVAPERAGFYHLGILGPGGERVLNDITLAVLVPFSAKRGSSLNGYRIGMYRGERRGRAQAPTGFLEVSAGDVALPVSEHLSVADFLTRDDQTVWPRYAALDPRLLDKLELVFAEIASWNGGSERAPVQVDVHSGFRTPLHNRGVPRAANDSRHQFGDAADVIVDADRDGKITSKDVKLIALAVEIVEREHPDLVGGLGEYTHNGSPYAHIDTRGNRARWRG